MCLNDSLGCVHTNDNRLQVIARAIMDELNMLDKQGTILSPAHMCVLIPRVNAPYMLFNGELNRNLLNSVVGIVLLRDAIVYTRRFFAPLHIYFIIDNKNETLDPALLTV
jgi:hypothetical protein